MDKPTGYKYWETPNDGQERHTIKTWCNMVGIKVIDPDGFDRTDSQLMVKYFTVEEFNQGLNNSTLEYKNDRG